jgi:phospholipid/cholesterol/gamma-HCH transport system permease protein
LPGLAAFHSVVAMDTTTLGLPAPGFVASKVYGLWSSLRRAVAFGLIALGAMVVQRRKARAVVGPLVVEEVFRAGPRLAPIVGFLGAALGVLFVGQTAALLDSVGASNLTGPLLVTVVIRELGPLVSGLVVLARVGASSVIELGAARAMGEVEALEALGIDPIHYLVTPKVIGFTLAVGCLTTYFIVIAILSGYAFAFTRGLPVTFEAFVGEIARALDWIDFPLLMIKTAVFGAFTGLVVCYHGIARPIRLEAIGGATAGTVATCVVGCLLIDGCFIPLYLLL